MIIRCLCAALEMPCAAEGEGLPSCGAAAGGAGNKYTCSDAGKGAGEYAV